MKDTLISFETAKLAKDCGFDIHTENWWVETLQHQLHIPRSGLETFSAHEPRILNHKPMERYHITHASAPTQSLLQKWLREKHNIQICLQPIYGGNLIEGKQTGWLCYTPWQDEEFNNLPSISVSHYSYEDALEDGLQGALKFIKS